MYIHMDVCAYTYVYKLITTKIVVGYQSTLKVQCSYDLITLEWSRVVYPAEEGYFIYYTCENQAGNKVSVHFVVCISVLCA